jgi:hypothetical protein
VDPGPDPVDPPFGGTIFIDPDIITSDDPTTLTGVTDAGRGMRRMFDRRVNDWIDVEAILFEATFSDGPSVEVQVNPEFATADAGRIEAVFYADAIGRLPRSLRTDVRTVWIHRGIEPFGGGNDNLLIHVGQGARYVADGILEETLVHEAVHTSIDAAHRSAPGWVAAQATDPTFISTYARDFPDREDLAESFLPYLAIRYREDRISASLRSTIMATIPHRIAYFDGLGLDALPVE